MDEFVYDRNISVTRMDLRAEACYYPQPNTADELKFGENNSRIMWQVAELGICTLP